MNDDPLRAMTFDNHPDPMWIYDIESLRFLEVNEAALAKYGYSRQEFLTMSLEDIRAAEEIPALRENVRSVTAGFDRAGVWRHRLKDGKEIHVDIVSHTIDWQGLRAELVCARDLRRSLQRVCAEGMSDAMGVRRYPIPKPASRGGGFGERYWSTVNTPVKDSRGDILFIIHRVEDVTELVRSRVPAHEQLLADLEDPVAQLELEGLEIRVSEQPCRTTAGTKAR